MWAISKRFSQSACHFFWYSSCLHWHAPRIFLVFYLRHIKCDKQDFFGILQVLTAIGNFCIISIAIGIIIEIIVMYPIQHRPYRQGINNLLVLLIGGIPIAMPTVLSVTMAIGSHRLSQQVLHFFSCFSSFVPLLFHHVGMSTHWQGHLTLADYRAGIVQVIMKLFAWHRVLLRSAWLPLRRWLEWMCSAATRQGHLPWTSLQLIKILLR